MRSDLERLDSWEAPDQWEQIERRAPGDLPPEPHRARSRLAAGVVAAAVAVVGLGFGFLQLSGLDDADDQATRQPSDVPSSVVITCTQEGAQVPPVAQVTDKGVRFQVENESNADEVLILGVSGEAGSHGADIDLSGSTGHTFQIPPGEFVVGCYTDGEMPSGRTEEMLAAPGLVPVEVTDPDGLYASPELRCDGSGTDGSNGLGREEDTRSPEEILRSRIAGIEPTDTIDRAGYPEPAGEAPAHVVPGSGAYRIVRSGHVVAAVELRLAQLDSDVHVTIMMESCSDAGLDVANWRPGS
jgi:hypothetical protein